MNTKNLFSVIILVVSTAGCGSGDSPEKPGGIDLQELGCNSNQANYIEDENQFFDDSYICDCDYQFADRLGSWDYPGRQGLWDYPVKPGTEEWKNLQSNEEKVSACQIPEDILLTLSTEDLTDLCLRYPLLSDFLAFDNLNIGLDKLFNDFNGIRELYSREDAVIYLIRRYFEKIQCFSCFGGEFPANKGMFIISVYSLEGLLSRIDNIKYVKIALKALVDGYEKQYNYYQVFNSSNFEKNFFAREHVISKMCEKFNTQSYFQLTQETMDYINELSYQLIK